MQLPVNQCQLRVVYIRKNVSAGQDKKYIRVNFVPLLVLHGEKRPS